MWDSDGRETQNIKQIIILNQYQTLSLPQYEYQSEMGLGMFQGRVTQTLNGLVSCYFTPTPKYKGYLTTLRHGDLIETVNTASRVSLHR